MNQNNSRNFSVKNLICNLLPSFVFVLLFFSGNISTATAQTMQTTQRSVYISTYTNVGGFLESLPNDYSSNPTKKYPLLIALHGSGEIGNGTPGILEKVDDVGIPKLLKNKMFPASFTVGGKSYSFIVLSPQMKTGSDWQNSIQSVIDYAKSHYRVDEQRIYLTGLSMGGVATLSYAASTVARGKGLAAALLVCPGWAGNDFQIKSISSSQLPIWVTNNSGDNPSTATSLVNKLNSAIPPPPKALLTIFNKTGHDAWTATYNPNFRQDGLSVYEWMLSKSRSTQPNPTPPVLTANAGADQIITLPTNTVTLDASGSKVSSGTITSYSWAKVSGPTTGLLSLLSNGLQAKLTGLIAGVYTYQLTAKDSNGGTATDNVTVTVKAAASSTNPPVANAGYGGVLTLPVNSITLNGFLSKPAAGSTITSYAWSKYSGPSTYSIVSPSLMETEVKSLIAGTYVFRLKVTDNYGLSSTGDVTVVVKEGSATTLPPTANAGYGGILTLPVNSITLNGFLSKPAAGSTITSYAWSKYSGPSSYTIVSPSAMKTAVTSLTAGTYIFRLKVTDNYGLSSTGDVTVVVKAAVASRSAQPATTENGDLSLTFIPDDKKFSNALDVSIGPNPVQSNMNIWVKGNAKGKASILLYNTSGKLQLQQEFTKDAGSVNKQINISKLPAGIYIVHVIVDGGNKKVLRIVKQQ